VGSGACHDCSAMYRRARTRAGALLLALILTFGSGLALVHGSAVAAEAASLADAGHHGPSAYDGCDDGHDCAPDPGSCLSLCASVAQGLLPGEPLLSPPNARARFAAAGLIPAGCFNSPEHGPPKLLAPADA
jgi:hypothetical protein